MSGAVHVPVDPVVQCVHMKGKKIGILDDFLYENFVYCGNVKYFNQTKFHLTLLTHPNLKCVCGQHNHTCFCISWQHESNVDLHVSFF